MPTPQHRAQIVLPPEERALAEAIALHLRKSFGADGGISGAIRASIRAYARELSIEIAEKKPAKMKTTASPK